MSPPRLSYLERAGLSKGSVYAIGILLAGGGYTEKHRSDSELAMQAQIVEMTTAVALNQQLGAIQGKKLEDLDRDLRALTRAVDRLPLRVAAIP